MKSKPRRRYKKGPAKRKNPRTRSSSGGAVWDQAARWYDTLVGMKGSDYQQSLILPGTLKLLQLKKNERVLDLACGQGVLCRFLQKKGYPVEGLDVSEELIASARRRTPEAVKFHHADARDPKALKGETFDAIACLLAIQNMEDLVPVFRNVSRWLKPRGRFVMVLTHPCFRIPRQSHWGFDEEKQIQFRRVDWYATETSIPILTPPMRNAEVFTLTYHRPLQSYFEALGKAGLVVDRLEEWCSGKTSSPGRRAKAENRARKEIPLFMALRAKISDTGSK